MLIRSHDVEEHANESWQHKMSHTTAAPAVRCAFLSVPPTNHIRRHQYAKHPSRNPAMHVVSGIHALLLSSLVTAYRPCPLLGSVFQPPTSLCDTQTFQDALRDLTTALDHATEAGNSSYGPIPAESSAFSIGIFDANTPGDLFSYQSSSSHLRQGTEGVQEVSQDSVYRVGSLSKLITTYLFLIEVGPKYWREPITDFVSELADAARTCSSAENAVDCVDWSEVTLGALASHMAGIPRDCRFMLALQLSPTRY